MSPRALLGIATLAVAASALVALEFGCANTQLYAHLWLVAWRVIAAFSANPFGYINPWLFGAVFCTTSVVAFNLPIAITYPWSGARWPRVTAAFIAIWTLLFLTALFLLFPTLEPSGQPRAI